MRMIEIDYEAQPPIDSYGPGGFRIADQWYAGGLILLSDGIFPIAPPISIVGLRPVFDRAADIDVLLIGQGADIAPIARELRSALDEAGIGFEIMSTPSACRTYNVLLTEDRRVGVALLPADYG
ncbi:MAG: Mth938-like domain-containing protein [Pseudomonadota bacterium]